MFMSRGYSPLSQITRANVRELRLAWVWPMASSNNETTPLVHDGVMYLVNPVTSCRHLTGRPGTSFGSTAGLTPPSRALRRYDSHSCDLQGQDLPGNL